MRLLYIKMLPNTLRSAYSIRGPEPIKEKSFNQIAEETKYNNFLKIAHFKNFRVETFRKFNLEMCKNTAKLIIYFYLRDINNININININNNTIISAILNPVLNSDVNLSFNSNTAYILRNNKGNIYKNIINSKIETIINIGFQNNIYLINRNNVFIRTLQIIYQSIHPPVERNLYSNIYYSCTNLKYILYCGKAEHMSNMYSCINDAKIIGAPRELFDDKIKGIIESNPNLLMLCNNNLLRDEFKFICIKGDEENFYFKIDSSLNIKGNQIFYSFTENNETTIYIDTEPGTSVNKNSIKQQYKRFNKITTIKLTNDCGYFYGRQTHVLFTIKKEDVFADFLFYIYKKNNLIQ